MTNSKQYQSLISRLRPAAANAALRLVAVLVFGVIATLSSQAQTFKKLYTFTGGVDGENSWAGLVRDAAGNLYGTTHYGGSSNGVVFKLDSHRHETVLHSFAGYPTDGAQPYAGLIQDEAGNLYGTTEYGGSRDGGSVFRVDTTGKEEVLYSFTGLADGCDPVGGLLRDNKGNLYGTTGQCGSGFGTVFKLSKTGRLTVLHSFGMSDGAFPAFASLLRDNKGNLYGVAQDGGTFNYGVVYMLSSSGKLTVLHSFAGGATDGCYPRGTPVLDDAGTLYGTTQMCGPVNDGVIWKVNKRGKETVLHNFAGGSSDGAEPVGGLLPDAQGSLYGDTSEGGGTGCDGGHGCGTVFKLGRNGRLSVLHSFGGGTDGSSPWGDLIRDGKGNLYGTAVYGGRRDSGTVWRLTP